MPGETTDPVSRFLEGYVPPAGVPDELLQPDGEVRPVWAGFIKRLASMPPEKLAARMAHGDQYLRDAGVHFRRYGADDATRRDWPLSHIPLLISEDDWQEIAAALTERADLLERIVADLYGENRLVSEGHLPAALIAQNPEWLRPLVGVKPRSGHFLHFVAFDIGRGPEGRWWVLGDRTQAPSGAGFALENRMATTRIYSDIFAGANVTRLAAFFRAFRDTLMDMRAPGESRVGILTPGPMNETYFEHAYIARYLGFALLEGEDLVVQDGRLMVRTINGLGPISVLWRRLDAAWADPLELEEGSRIGTAGLLRTVRDGNATMVNALGAGILEMRALQAFMPRLSQLLDGKALRMPNIATWWCGQKSERDHVRANTGQMTLSSAHATGLAYETGNIDPPEADLDAWITRMGPAIVGQEQVRLSTAPAFVEGTLRPRPMSLRVFLARTRDGWRVMPGGFARIGSSPDSNVLAMQQGGRVADVWVIGRQTEPAETNLPRPDGTFARTPPGALPSRAADNLYWLGRYVERSEHLVRMLRAHHARLAETDTPESPLLALTRQHLEVFGCRVDHPVPEALVQTIGAADGSAGHVSDRFSVDGTLALRDLHHTVRAFAERVETGDDAARAMSVLLRKLSGFSGLVHDNMYRFTGWRFLSIGRALERAANITSCLATFAAPDAPAAGLDLAIEVGDSVMTHHRRYTVATNRETVLDLLALDELNPRSVLCQLGDIEGHLDHLPGSGQHRQMTPLSRALLKARTDLALQTPGILDTDILRRLSAEISDMSDQLTLAYLS
ncbi:putative circularly permuted ATP-grasp superfamily protein [Aliiruegeria haliotis]|uniref:Putative circularly permuted ATP-grasp superfamily protein n=1 Tax=Aliiruegeria haliotis TaxID=1280846 RepID=A0A2T0RKM8_9RHOB|nr:circularly permuted type 2 ATP-grasp protein [Aliiruegeria haliotis]PRY21744.1 putative circularly permuted ATP-grasp superfamily protein [Aliiruegeria haliotis]